MRRTETRFTGSRKPTATQPLDPTADREASDGRDCGGRGTGRRMPQGGGIPGEPGRRTGGEIQRRRPNRQRDQTPEARPRRTSVRRQARVTGEPGSGNGDPKGTSGTINRAVKGICGCIESARVSGEVVCRTWPCGRAGVPDANRRRGCRVERRGRSLSGQALKGGNPESAPG